ncbi:site-specific integrase [Streptomyces sp. NPDC048309]|uniref:tyrosine-type recombinase/integrase n=1 Tax=Streptomyces sp. NPDC048309 TaxID=3154618 RepID=UPI003411DEBC
MSIHAVSARAFAGRAEELMAAVDPEFLDLLGWSPDRSVLTFPIGHPLLGMPLCRVVECGCVAYSTSGLCRNCERRWKSADGAFEMFVAAPRPVRRRNGVEDCVVAGCSRPWVTRTQQLCSAHQYQRAKMDLDLPEFLRHPAVLPLPSFGTCVVAACDRQRSGKVSAYCLQHTQRRTRMIREGTFPGDEVFRRAMRAVSKFVDVNLRGLALLVVAEVIYGLQERIRGGTKTPPWHLRPVCELARTRQVSTLDELDPALLCRRRQALLNALTTASRRLGMTPESERHKDVWDAAAFGRSGNLNFTGVRQPWLREAVKAAVCDELPRRRGVQARGQMQTHINAFVKLSDSLHAQRDDRGAHPALLERQDMVNFSNRLAFLAEQGEISTYTWISIARVVRKWLSLMRSMGLTRPGQPLHGLPADFMLLAQDIPDEPEDSEAGKDLPDEVMRQLCAHLDLLEERSSREVRVAVELLIDTGRRPFEICHLPYDCLTWDADGKPVLLYDNHKELRLRRRLPIPEATAALIIAQQERVRARFPTTAPGRLVLLPSVVSNPEGTKAISDVLAQHRDWVAALPDVALTMTVQEEGKPMAKQLCFDKEKIFPYAYRHTYAQRHADAGVPVDVLRQLMDHRQLTTTQRYYRVGEQRRREAIDRVTAMQFDRHGNRIWRRAKALLDSEHARRAVGEVAVPYGVCTEPSNVAAGGHDCPVRFRCVGCGHFRTDVSYLPDLEAHLADLLRGRERLAAFSADTWARNEAMPSDEEITRVRRLIRRVRTDLDDLTDEDRTQIQQAVAVVRRSRQVVTLGMPRVAAPVLNPRPERPSV